MATEKKEIVFHKSMTVNKRNPNFAYLRKNVLNEDTPGLYPSIDYYLTEPDGSPVTSDWDLLDVLGSNRPDTINSGTFDIKAIWEDGDDIRFTNIGSNSESNTAITDEDMLAGAFGSDGIYILTDEDGNVYKASHSSSSTTLVGNLDGNSDGIDVGGFDGLRYWWAGGNGIWRQLPGEDGYIVMESTGLEFEKMDFYRDYMVLWSQRGPDVYVYFWDKQNTVVFSKRVIIKNATFIAGGVVDGVLMTVYSVGDTTNAKEYEGKIVVSAFDGEGFRELNSIKAGRENVSFTDTGIKGTTMDTGNQVLMFCVDDNDRTDTHTDLYQNYVYKVRNNGMIEVEMLPAVNGSRNYASVARVFYNFNLVAVGDSSGNLAKIYINDETNREYDDYDGYTQMEYITEFMENPFNYHRLDGISIAFEKLFKNGDNPEDGPERLEIYCRTSEREAFTLIGEITPALVIANVDTRQDPTTASTEIPVKKQIYQFTKRADGTTLPEYNEIQFKFKSFNGFSVIGAWREYSYITRNII